MKCEKCGKHDASVFVQNELNGLIEEYYICSSCASERELSTKLGLNVTSNTSKKVCVCKTSFEEISESGYVGCPNCYVTFEEELMPMIASLHGHTIHKGKIPLSKKQRLQIQIEAALNNKFYDLAKKLQMQLDEEEGDRYE